MNEDVKSENAHIHSRADELIACLEGEIAERDEVIVGLTNSRDFWREKAIAADDELAAIKAQGVGSPIRFWIIGDAGQKKGATLCKKSSRDGSLAFFETEEDATRAAKRHAGTAVYSVDYYKSAPLMMPERAIKDGGKFSTELKVTGWNACMDEVARLNASPVQQVSVPDGFCIGAWRDALEKIAKYAPQVNCEARTELERAGLIAVHALIAFSAPQFRHARGTQTASNAAPAAPAADAGHVFYGMDGNHP